MAALPNNRLSPTVEPPNWATPDGTRRVTFPAMGTTITCLLPDFVADEAGQLVTGLFAEWEATLSRFRSESELSLLNRAAGTPQSVSPLLGAVLAQALLAAEATDGLYDPTLLPQLRQAGYDRSFAQLPKELPAATTTPPPGGGWRAIWFDARQRQVFLPAGVELDFGGIAKGMAVDAALDQLRRAGVARALITAGGDLGVIRTPLDSDHWPVATPDGMVLALRHGALATSGVERHRWRQGGVERHHLLDPRTGAPAQTGLFAVTVIADRCMQAEVAAKVAFILGPVAGLAFLEQRQLVGAMLRTDGASFTTSGWPHPRPLPIQGRRGEME